jgi:hypothetical protein
MFGGRTSQNIAYDLTSNKREKAISIYSPKKGQKLVQI